MSKTPRDIIYDLLEYVVKFAEQNEEPEAGGCWDAVEAARAYLKLSTATQPKFNEIAQVVVFASSGITQSVAVRALPKGDVPCIVVDYDDRHDDAGSLSPEDFERKHLGISREEFDKQATYIW